VIGPRGNAAPMPPERIVAFRPRTILTAAALIVGVAIVLWVVWVSRRVLVWALVSVFLALALNPAVEALQLRGLRQRAAAAAVVYLLAIATIAGIGALIVPTIVQQVNDLVDAAPGYVRDLTAGRGPLGFLETKYHVVERVQDAVKGDGGSGRLAGGASAALDVTRTVVTFVVGVVTITFMTFFMLVEGPAWLERLYGLMPARSQARWRAIGHDIYRTVGGYVTGNLLISLIAGVATTIVLYLVGVPYALALGLLVAILDLIPLAGATFAAIVVTLVALTQSVTAAVVVLAFFIVYQQLENHLLQPLVYGRTVQLSPLAILISVLVGAEVAGVIGALGAIPVAGTIQILIVDWQRHRRAPDERDAQSPHDVGASTSTRVGQPQTR
jgi:predicted PurR-regulated permease PerM